MNAIQLYGKLSTLRQVTTRTAAQLTGQPMSTTSMALSRLAAEGLVTRIKPGSWLIGPTARKAAALVAAAAHPYVAYLSGWSAFRHHGRIQQIPEIHFGVTLGRPSEIKLAGISIRLHHIRPELFTGYVYAPAMDGLVASPEKAFFDLAYFSAMNRRSLGSALPEADLRGFRWKLLHEWVRQIPSAGVRTSVERSIRKLRRQQDASE